MRPFAIATTLASTLLSIAPAFAADYHIGPWSPGMTREEVTSFEAFGPYVPVPVTGGLETFHASIDGKITNVTFVFHGDKVDYIQWNLYEGPSYDEARGAALRLFDELDGPFGGVDIEGVKVNDGERADREMFGFLFDRTLGPAAEANATFLKKEDVYGTFKFVVKPRTQATNSRLSGLFAYAGRFDTYYVMLMQDALNAPPRGVSTGASFEKR